MITTDADVDVFKVDSGAGAATFSATPAAVSPNLDIQLELRNGAGTVLASDNPASATVDQDVASGLSASISTTLPAAGPYYLFVSGVGSGNPADHGYSGYASIGRYSLSGTVPGATRRRCRSTTPRPWPKGPAGVDTTATFTVTMSAAASSTVTVVASTASGTAVAGSDFTAASSTLTFPAGTTSRPFPVTVVGDAAVEPVETFAVNLSSPSGADHRRRAGHRHDQQRRRRCPAQQRLRSVGRRRRARRHLNGTNVGATKEVGEPNHAGAAAGSRSGSGGRRRPAGR